ncbi:MAG: hypothetical protein RR662_03890 [Clostridia bacterium]
MLLTHKTKKIIEQQVRQHKLRLTMINDIRESMINSASGDLNNYIKISGTNSEKQLNVVCKIEKNIKLNELLVWEKIINVVLYLYKKIDLEKYNYICSYYIVKNPKSAERTYMETGISRTRQFEMRNEFLLDLALMASKYNLIDFI